MDLPGLGDLGRLALQTLLAVWALVYGTIAVLYARLYWRDRRARRLDRAPRRNALYLPTQWFTEPPARKD